MNQSDDLQRHFAALREEDAARAPSFSATLAAARSRQQPRDSARWAWGALVGAAATIAVIALALRLADPEVLAPGGDVPPMGTVDQWVAPTDGLLASAGLLAASEASPDELAFFSSPTADLFDLGEDLTRTP
jgi:hypothetical protein